MALRNVWRKLTRRRSSDEELDPRATRDTWAATAEWPVEGHEATPTAGQEKPKN